MCHACRRYFYAFPVPITHFWMALCIANREIARMPPAQEGYWGCKWYVNSLLQDWEGQVLSKKRNGEQSLQRVQIFPVVGKGKWVIQTFEEFTVVFFPLWVTQYAKNNIRLLLCCNVMKWKDKLLPNEEVVQCYADFWQETWVFAGHNLFFCVTATTSCLFTTSGVRKWVGSPPPLLFLTMEGTELGK